MSRFMYTIIDNNKQDKKLLFNIINDTFFLNRMSFQSNLLTHQYIEGRVKLDFDYIGIAIDFHDSTVYVYIKYYKYDNPIYGLMQDYVGEESNFLTPQEFYDETYRITNKKGDAKDA